MSDNPGDAPAPEAVAPETPAAAAPEAPAAPAPAAASTDAVPAKAKKSKKGLIIGLTCGILGAGAIAGGAFAIVNLMKGGDPVSDAIIKLLDDGGAKNIAISGNLAYTPAYGTSTGMGIGELSVDIDSKISTDTKVSDTDLKLKGNIAGIDANIGLGLKVLASGETYFKISGFKDSFFTDLSGSTTNCIGGSYGTNCDLDVDYSDVDCTGMFDCIEPYSGSSSFGGDFTQMFMGTVVTVLSGIDGQWVKIPADTKLAPESLLTFNSSAQCLVSATKNMKDYGKELADLYKKYPYITSSTDNITIAKKKDTIYRLSFDNEKMASFMNEASNSKFVSDLTACSSNAVVKTNVTAAQIKEVTDAMPPIYVEINGNKEFTRVYAEVSGIKADLSFDYPASFDVTAPASAKDINDIFSEEMFSAQGGSSSFDLEDVFSGSGLDDYDFGDIDYDADFDSDSFDYDSLLQMLQ